MTDLVDPATEPAPTEPPAGRRVTFTKVVLTVIVLLLVAMWVYAFGFASKKAAYRVDDAAWRERAQSVCQSYEQQRLQLVDTSAGYISNPTNEQMLQRADVVDRATDILEDEVAELTTVVPDNARDRSLIGEYRSYYQMVIADRRAYTERLRAFEREPYLETKVDGGPVSNLLTDFAVVNQIPACAPPGELGGDA